MANETQPTSADYPAAATAEKPTTDSQDEKPGEVVSEFTPGLDDEKIKMIVIPVLRSAIVAYDDRKKKYSRLEHLYFGKVAEGSPVQNLPTQMSSGMGFQLHETVMPLLITGKMRADMTGVEEGDDDAANANEQLLDYQIAQDDLEKPLEDWIRQAGKTIGGLRVDKKVEKIKTYRRKKMFEMRLPFTQKVFGVGPTTEVEEVSERFYHVLETIPYEDLIVPEARDNDSAPFIGQRHSKRVWEMEEDPRYKKDAVKQISERFAKDIALNAPNPDQYTISRGTDKDINYEALRPLVLEAEVELADLYFHYQGKMYLATVTYDTMEIVRSECVENWHQMYPIRVLSIYPVENALIGMSILEIVETDIDEYDIWLNIIFSVGLFDVQRPVIYDKDKVAVSFQKNPIKYEPGAMYPTTDINAFKLLEAPKIDQSHLNILTAILRRIQDKTGINDYIAGTASVDEDKTLGEVQLKTAQSKKRFTPILKHIRRELTKVFYMMVSNNQQYLPDGYEIRVLGRRGYKLKRLSSESIQGKFDIFIQGFEDIAIDEAQNVNRYRAMISDGVKLNQMAGMALVNIPYLARQLYENGYKVRDIEKILVGVQENVNASDQQKQAQALKAHQENLDPIHAIVRPDDDHAVHLDVHEAFLKSPQFQKLSPALQNALARHIMAHRQAMSQGSPQGGGAPQGANPAAPGGPSAGGPIPMIPPSDQQPTPPGE